MLDSINTNGVILSILAEGKRPHCYKNSQKANIMTEYHPSRVRSEEAPVIVQENTPPSLVGTSRREINKM